MRNHIKLTGDSRVLRVCVRCSNDAEVWKVLEEGESCEECGGKGRRLRLYSAESYADGSVVLTTKEARDAGLLNEPPAPPGSL